MVGYLRAISPGKDVGEAPGFDLVFSFCGHSGRMSFLLRFSDGLMVLMNYDLV